MLAYTDYNPYKGKPYDVVESNEENNARTTDTSVTALPADLKVAIIAAPAENFSGEKTTVTVDGEELWRHRVGRHPLLARQRVPVARPGLPARAGHQPGPPSCTATRTAWPPAPATPRALK